MLPILFEPEVEQLLQGHVRRYDKGAVVIVEGGAAREFYLLVSGSVAVMVAGQEVRTIDKPGDFFGEVAALSYTTRTATVTAREDTICYELPVASLAVILCKSPRLAMNLIRSLTQSLADTTDYYREHHVA